MSFSLTKKPFLELLSLVITAAGDNPIAFEVSKDTQKIYLKASKSQGLKIFGECSATVSESNVWYIANAAKMKLALQCVESEEIDFEVYSNYISHNGEKIKFKVHLLDPVFVLPALTKMSRKAFDDLEWKAIIPFDREDITRIKKGFSFVPDTDELVIEGHKDKTNLVFSLPHKNSDNIEIALAPPSTPFGPIKVIADIFKIAMAKTLEINIKIENQQRVITLQMKNDNYSIDIVTTPIH
jgi:hypothetical protein